MYTYKIDQLENIKDVAGLFVEDVLSQVKVVTFEAPMGTGKTTFIKAVCEVLGVNDQMNSPTFSIVNEYDCEEKGLIYHFDCYRIESVHDLYNIGVEDYLYADAYCFIEWPELMYEFISNEYALVRMSLNEDNSRNIEVELIK